MARKQQPGSATIWAVLGSSGAGKGLWIKARLRELNPRRLLVWDYLNEYGEFTRPMRSLQALTLAVVRAKDGPFRYAYTARTGAKKTLAREFEAFCRIAWASPGSVVLVEEVSRVTSASFAPAAWAQLCNMGRHRAIHVIAVSQHPAQMDKSLLGNATLIHCGMLRTGRHRAAVAEEMDLTPHELGALAPLEYVERDFSVFPYATRRGSVAAELPRARARAPAAALTDSKIESAHPLQAPDSRALRP
jgi:hypothetical protein